MTSYVENVNITLSAPIPHLDLDGPDREALKWIYKDREYFKTLEFKHGEISDWLRGAVNDTLIDILHIGEDLSDHVVEQFNTTLEDMKMENNTDKFDFFKLIFADDDHKSYEEWVFSLNWMRAIPL